MAVKFANLASTTLASSLSNTATSISVTSSSSFPTLGSGDYFYASIGEGSGSEIVKVTGVSSNTFTVVRGQDGTSAQNWSSGSVIALRVVAAALDDIASAADTESVSIDGDTMTGDLTVPNLNVSSTDIDFTGSGGYVSTTGAYALRLQTNNTEALRLTSSQNAVFAGTISSGAITTTGDVKIYDNANDVLVFGSGLYQTIGGSSGSNNINYRTYADHIFKTGTGASSKTDGTERFRITSNGITASGSVNLGTTTDGSRRFKWYNDNNHSLYYDSNLLTTQSADVFTYWDNVVFRHRDSTNAVIIGGSAGAISSGAITTSGDLKLTAGSGQRFIEIASGTTNAKTWRIYNGISWNPDALLIYNHTDDSTALTIEPGKLGVNRGANSLSHTLDVGGTVAISGTQIIDSSRNASFNNVTLATGYNLQWGSGYSSGHPSISATSSAMFFYPTGNVSGANFRLYASMAEVRDGNRLRFQRSGNSAYGELYYDTGENINLYSSWGGKYLRFTRDGHLQLSVTTRIADNGNATLGTISSGTISTSGDLVSTDSQINIQTTYNNVVYTGGYAAVDYFVGNTSLRAPIFYDVQNTSYFLDPAATAQ